MCPYLAANVIEPRRPTAATACVSIAVFASPSRPKQNRESETMKKNNTPRRSSTKTRRFRKQTIRCHARDLEKPMLENFINELACLSPCAVLLFHGLLNGKSAKEIAATMGNRNTESEIRAAISEAAQECPIIADVYDANGHLL